MLFSFLIYKSFIKEQSKKISFYYEKSLSSLVFINELQAEEINKKKQKVVRNFYKISSFYEKFYISNWVKIRIATLLKELLYNNESINLYQSIQKTVIYNDFLYFLVVIAVANSYENIKQYQQALEVLDMNFKFLHFFSEEILWKSFFLSKKIHKNKIALFYLNKLVNKYPNSYLWSKAKILKEFMLYFKK